uniref:Uncharacterized protein n=1 Tax=Rhizophora mucronata TaxID=61149 RepID=A0A2P2PZE2_RHIMU
MLKCFNTIPSTNLIVLQDD